MRKSEAKEIFIRHLPVGRYDYWSIEQAWASFTDALCKDGKITEKQWNNWLTPFKYGRTVVIRRRKEMIYG